MPDRCYQLEEIEEIARLDPQNPRLDHARRCARCRALLTTYREFMTPSRRRKGSDPADADARLTAFVEHSILKRKPLPKDVPSQAPLPPTPPQTRRGNPLKRLLMELTARPLKPAAALVGSLAVVLLILSLADDRDHSPDRIVLREESGSAPAFHLDTPQVLSDGQIRLSWQPVAGADAYQVILLGHELSELAHLEAGGLTSLTFAPATIPELPGSGSAILWRVAAMRAGDEIARSPLQSMRLP